MAQNTNKINHYNIDPLNGDNYEAWKFRVKMILTEHNVEKMIEKKYRDEDYEIATQKEEAKKKKNKCKSILVQCIDDMQIDIIRNKETAYDMWISLQDVYEKRSLSGKLFLRRKLMSMKMNEGEKLDDFISRFEHVLCQLKSSGAEVKEEDAICTLLLALPKSYETIVTVLENMTAETLDLNYVKTKLKIDSEKKKENDGEQNELTRAASFMSNRSTKCYNCGENGHIKRYCKKPQIQPGRNNTQGNSYRGARGRGTSNQRGTYRGRGNTVNRFKDHQGWDQSHTRHNYNQQMRRGDYVEKDSTKKNSICFVTSRCNNIKTVSNENILFFVDSGCTDHLVNDKEYFSDFIILNTPIRIAVAKDKSYLEAVGIENINIQSYVNGNSTKCTIKNVFYIPNLRKNLLFVRKLEMFNISVVFEKGKVKLFDKNRLIGLGLRNNLYEISFKVLKNECLNIDKEDEKLKLWHRRYGHINYSNLEKLIKNDMVDGIDKLKLNKVEFCESCVNGKMTKLQFGTRKKSKDILEIVHSDVCGPINPISHDGDKYFVTFIDDFSNFICVYMLKNKSDVFGCFKKYIQMVQSKFNKRVSTLRCDNGREYVSGDMLQYCKLNGTFIDYTIPYIPQQNGKAERFNRTLVEKSMKVNDK